MPGCRLFRGHCRLPVRQWGPTARAQRQLSRLVAGRLVSAAAQTPAGIAWRRSGWPLANDHRQAGEQNKRAGTCGEEEAPAPGLSIVSVSLQG